MKKPHINPSQSKSGFTLVELSLAMAFIAVLLIIIAITATSLVAIYQKGLSIKAVNSVGRNLIDEFTRAINTAPSVDTTSLCNSLVKPGASVDDCVRDHANLYIFQEVRYDDPGDNSNNTEQLAGIFCTGYYSYIWNTKAGIENSKTLKLKYTNENSTGTTPPASALPVDVSKDPPIRLARIVDRNYRLCSVATSDDYKSELQNIMDNGGEIDITHLNNSNPDLYYRIPVPDNDFLREFDTDLELADLTIFPISQDAVTLRSFFSGTFVLSTLRGNPEILLSGDYCDPNGSRDPNHDTASSHLSLGSEFNYCAINKFNFAARTAGSGV